jgi:hypothetical protein
MRSFLLTIALICSASLASAAPVNLPKRKSGLWELKMSNDMGSHIIQQCIDEQTDDLAQDQMGGLEGYSCRQTDVRREGDKLIVESTCTIEGSTAQSRAVISGRYDSAYTVDVKSSYDPPLYGMKESSSNIVAKWLGACKAGQQPGDVSTHGMPSLNIKDIMKNLPKRP